MNTLARDVVLILIAVGLLVAVFLPESSEPGSDDASDHLSEEPTSLQPLESDSRVSVKPPAPESEVTREIAHAPHPLFPVVAGLEWTFMVEGGVRWVSDRSWRMTVTRVPDGNTPGEALVGFGAERTRVPLHMDNEALRFAGFPFFFPPSIESAAPSKLSGSLIPEHRAVFSGATWNQIIEREITYQSMDEQRRVFTERAMAIQTDRAQVSGPVDMVVPAGVFKAWRVEWTGRMDIRAGKKRQVLVDLTAEPFRRDVMWFAEGAGLVKRRVTLATHPNEEIIFSLISLKINDDNEGESK